MGSLQCAVTKPALWGSLLIAPCISRAGAPTEPTKSSVMDHRVLIKDFQVSHLHDLQRLLLLGRQVEQALATTLGRTAEIPVELVQTLLASRRVYDFAR